MSLALAVATFVNTRASVADPQRAQVMIVGVSHFVARHDFHNSVFEDSPLSKKRQLQINIVIEHLSRFHPTKVLIEEPFGDPTFARRYQRFIASVPLQSAKSGADRIFTTERFALPADEDYQYGFKLAARAKNRTIYPIDTFGPTLRNDDTRIDEFIKTHFKRVDDAPSDAFDRRGDALERTGSYLDLLRYLNSDSAIRANASWYGVMDGMGREAHQAGSAYVSQWYARNCYIFSNMLSVIRPGDRVVVIIGQGHEYLLREFVRLDPHLRSVDSLTYLK